MKNRTLFGFFIECIFMTFCIYVIVINVVRFQSFEEFFDVSNIDGHAMNFDGWHSYEPVQFRGMSWFFDKLESFPGFEYFKDTVKDVIAHVPKFEDTMTNNLLDILKFMATMFFLPLRAFGTMLADIFRCIGWFFTFLF